MSSLCSKYRPNNFEDIEGQSMALKILKGLLIREKKNNEIKHSFLLHGKYGSGKTSTARILFKAFNCTGDSLVCNKCESCISNYDNDLIEIDAARLNGIDNIRSLVNQTYYLPEFRKFRVFIIDEAHELSKDAFNGLLKTLEEPPSHIKFILVTSFLEKIPATIISRCFDISFFPISKFDILERLKYICKKENFNFTNEILNIIADHSNGSLRDAITTLEKIENINLNLKEEEIMNFLRIFSIKSTCEILNLTFSGKTTEAINLWRKFRDSGFSEKDFCHSVNDALIDFYFLNTKVENSFNEHILNIHEKFNLSNEFLLNAVSNIAHFSRYDYSKSAENIIMVLSHLPHNLELNNFFKENFI